jgi:hypothetical protein
MDSTAAYGTVPFDAKTSYQADYTNKPVGPKLYYKAKNKPRGKYAFDGITTNTHYFKPWAVNNGKNQRPMSARASKSIPFDSDTTYNNVYKQHNYIRRKPTKYEDNIKIVAESGWNPTTTNRANYYWKEKEKCPARKLKPKDDFDANGHTQYTRTWNRGHTKCAWL